MQTSWLLFQVILCCSCWHVFGNDLWSCPKAYTDKECPKGQYFCNCPGDGKRVSYDIECGKKGLYRCQIPKEATLGCARYNLCKTCKSTVGKGDKDVCTSCLDIGYQGPQCNQDVNECLKENGGCEHQCENTLGSYCCHCVPGYSKHDDKHSCIRLSCGRPEDEEGLMITSLPIPGVNDWEYETSAEYSCARLNHVIVGENIRKCDLATADKPQHDCILGDREIGVVWNGQVPECVVECNPQEEHERCGVQGVDPVVCGQLGCCHHKELGTCHMRPSSGHHYAEFEGVRPQPADQVNPIGVQNTSVCKMICEAVDDCKSFAVKQLLASVSCYRFPYGRQHYVAQGELKADSDAIYYDPLSFSDDIDWKDERAEVLNQLDYGCFDTETVKKYLPLVAHVKGQLLTSLKCADTCRMLGYHYSGVRVDECRCGKDIPSEELMYSEEDENLLMNLTLNMVCSFNCSGDAGQLCGGESRYSVQMVPHDSRYLGCFDNSVHPMPIKRWDRDAHKTVEECIQECARIGFDYAGVQDGGACYCGLLYPVGAGSPQTKCDEPCVSDRYYRYCGSSTHNSVYRTPAAVDLNSNEVSHFAVNLYHSDERMTTSDTVLFTFLPQLRNYVTSKLVLSASVPFMAPKEDQFCSSGECYAPCRSLELGNQVITDQGYVTIRQFVVRYSDIKDILKNKQPKQVNIYAQAVYIDTNLVLDYALLIRARQIFIDREKSTYFHFSDRAPDLNIDEDEWQRIVHEGPYPDLLFQRLSYTCLRILISTNEQRFINIGYTIVNDLIAAPAKDPEQEVMVRSAAALKAKFLGIDFSNTHQVPLYNKNRLVSILETYYNKISVYENAYTKLTEDNGLLYADFLDLARMMNKIYKSTVVNEALVILQNIQETYIEVTAIQAEIENNYNRAVEKVQRAREDLVAELKNLGNDQKKESQLAFLTGLDGVILGAATRHFGTVAKTTGVMFGHPIALENTFNLLAALVIQMDLIVQQSKGIMSGDNKILKEKEGELVLDLELMVSMSVNTGKWKDLKDYSELVISGMMQPAAGAFRSSMSDYCMWGDALSQAMVVRAETLRQMLEKQAHYDLKNLLGEKSQVLEDAASSSEKRMDVMLVMQEQVLDICLDMNDFLLQYCQAYLFENLKECREVYRPSFEGSMGTLLLKINAAQRDSLYSADVPSSITRSVSVVNKNNALECEDPLVCPINCFDKSRFLVLTISPEDEQFMDIQKYRIKEIFLEFHGLDQSQQIEKMKFFIKNTGLFHDTRSEVYHFLTRPMHLAFERELSESGHVTIHADFPDDVHQISPFTTWVIEVIDEHGQLNLSGVSEIMLHFDGSSIPGF